MRLSLLRAPGKALMTFALLAAVSFAFIANAVEYIVVRNEIQRLGGAYPAVGYLSPINPNEQDVTAGVELLKDSPTIAFEDWRRYASGVMQGILNFDIHGYTSDPEWLDAQGLGEHKRGIHTSDALLCGTLIHVNEGTRTDDGVARVFFSLYLEVDTLLSGYPEYARAGLKATVYCRSYHSADEAAWAGELSPGDRVFLRVYIDTAVSAPHFTGERGGTSILVTPLSIRPLLQTGDGPLWYYKLAPDEQVDLSDPFWAELAREQEITRINQSTVLVTGTGDMSASPLVWNRPYRPYQYALTAGRWLDAEDDREARRVCLVHSELARRRGLKVGEMVTVGLRDALSYFDLLGYISTNDADTWRDYPVCEEEFEIVGVYFIRQYGLPPSDTNGIIIPNSVLPAGLGGPSLTAATADSYSFILRSHNDREAFLSEYRKPLAELGLRVVFLNDVARHYWAGITPLQRSKAFSAAVYGALTALALALTAFLYLRTRRREFAIRRALGVPKGAAVARLLAPIGVIGGFAVAAGGVPAWRYALSQAARSVTGVNEDDVASIALSPVWLAILCAAVFIGLLLCTFAGALRLAGNPVLELLHGVSATRRGRSSRSPDTAPPEPPPLLTPVRLPPPPAYAGGKNLASSGRFLIRHIRRSPVKTLLTAATAAAFVLALGWIGQVVRQNEEKAEQLYAETALEAEIVLRDLTSRYFADATYIEKRMAGLALDSGYIRDIIAKAAAAVNGEVIVAAFSNAADEALLSPELTRRLGVEAGDTVTVSHGGAEVEYTVGGVCYGEALLLPYRAADELGVTYFTSVEATIGPEWNRSLDEVREFLAPVLSRNDGAALKLEIWDEDFLLIIESTGRVLSLLAALYPVTVAVSVLMAAGLAVLMTLQNAKAAATLRVLGTTKRRVLSILCAEQFFVCAAGLLIGIVILAALLGRGAVSPLQVGLYLAGTLAGAPAAALPAANRMPLELLQVRE